MKNVWLKRYDDELAHASTDYFTYSDRGCSIWARQALNRWEDLESMRFGVFRDSVGLLTICEEANVSVGVGYACDTTWIHIYTPTT